MPRSQAEGGDGEDPFADPFFDNPDEGVAMPDSEEDEEDGEEGAGARPARGGKKGGKAAAALAAAAGGKKGKGKGKRRGAADEAVPLSSRAHHLEKGGLS